MPTYRIGSAGVANKLSALYRIGSAGLANKISRAYRIGNSGNAQIIFSSSGPVETTAATLKNQNNSTTDFYGGDTITLTRGAYTLTNSNTQYRMTIYKGLTPSLTVNDSNWEVASRSTYTESTSTSTTSITYSLTDFDAKDPGYSLIGEIRVTIGSMNYFFYTPFKVLSRISLSTTGLSASTTDTGATFSWSVGGIGGDSTYISNQVLTTRLSNAFGTIIDTASVPNGKLTTSDRSYIRVNTFSPATTYYSEIVVTANDSWKNTASPTTSFSNHFFTTKNALPQNTVAPTISPLNNTGNPTLGITLTANRGTWANVDANTTYQYDWYEEDWQSGFLNIYTNVGTTRTFSTKAGNFIYVKVTATNSDTGSGSAFSQTYQLYQKVTVSGISPTSAIANASTNFTFTVSNNPTSYTIDWGDGTSSYSSGSIAANTATVNASVAHTYTTTGSKTITVTAQPGSVTSTATVTVTGALPQNTVAPTIGPLNNAGGLPVVSTLTANRGTWANVDANTTYQYNWYREDWQTGGLSTFINVGTTRSFQSSDAGDFIYIRVTATNLDGGSSSVFSQTYSLYQQVSIGSISPTTVTQNSSANFAFTVSNNPTSYTINWGDGTSSYSSGSIAANTATVNASVAHTYTTTGSKTITVTAQPGSVTSTATITVNAPVVQVPVNSTLPSITPTSGTNATTFTVSNGTWTNSPTSYAYQWQFFNTSLLDWVNITTNGTSQTFLPTNYAGYTIRARVTASNSGGSSTPAISSNSVSVTSSVTVPGPPRSVALSRNETTFVTQWSWNCTWLAPNTGGTPTSYEGYREVGTGTIGNATLTVINHTSVPQTGLTSTSTTFTTGTSGNNRADAYIRACNSAGCSAYVSGNVG